jgi:hypothetical protein
VEPESRARCAACGAEASADARFCPECGGLLPASEPVSYERVDRDLFGVAPPGLLLTLSLVAFACGVVLLGLGHWISGAVLLVVAACFGVVFSGAARQLPDDRTAQGTFRAADKVRARMRLAGVSAVSWTRAGSAVVRLRLEQRRLRREQRGRIHALGEAVYREDDEAAAALKAEAAELGDRVERSEREALLARASASERVEHERSVAGATQILRR